MSRGPSDAGNGSRGGPSAALWQGLTPGDVGEMLEGLSDGIAVFDRDGRYRYLNRAAAEMLGRSAEDLLGNSIWEEFQPSPAFRHFFERVIATGEPARLVQHYEAWDRTFEVRLYPHEDDVVMLFRDVTDQQRIEGELRDRGERMAEAERIARFGVWEWDLGSGRVRWSDHLHRIYGVEPGEFGGTAEAFTELLHPDDRERVWGEISRAIESRKPFAFEERILRPDGEERTLLSQGHPVEGPDGSLRALVGVCHDVTDRLQIERALGASERRLAQILDNSPNVVAVKDLEGRYVMINTEAARVFGRPAEEILGSACEEVFPPEISEPQRANDRLAAAEGEPIYDEVVLVRDGAPRTFLTVTFALPDEAGRPIETCMVATDVTEDRETEGERLERRSWTERIETALDDDRLLAYAQPIVDLRGREVVSRELLARMLTAGAQAEVLQPAAFLPAAERYGLIRAIDERMVRIALEQDLDGSLQVNLSAVTLCDPEARERVMAMLGAAPRAAERIVFEITETAVPEHFEAALEFAEQATALGAKLALDDFGTGFGSLSYLDALPLSFLKIDLSFVQGLTSSARSRRLVESIVGIARAFELETIAEGVEDEDTLRLLGELGADHAQGYHLGWPAPLPVPVGAGARRSSEAS